MRIAKTSFVRNCGLVSPHARPARCTYCVRSARIARCDREAQFICSPVLINFIYSEKSPGAKQAIDSLPHPSSYYATPFI